MAAIGPIVVVVSGCLVSFFVGAKLDLSTVSLFLILILFDDLMKLNKPYVHSPKSSFYFLHIYVY